MEKTKQKFGWGVLILGVLLIAIGVCFVAFRGLLTEMTYAIAIVMLVFGVGYGSFTLARFERNLKFAMKIIVSVCAICCGVVTIIAVESAITVIANIFCLLMIVDGSFKLHTAIMSIRYKVFGWWFITVLAVAIIVCAFLVSKMGLVNDTENEIKTLHLALGFIIAADGIANVFAPIYTHIYTNRAIKSLLATSEEKPVEEAPAEEASVEETPAEEKPAEEAPAEEKPVEEAPAEEAPAEEAPAEEAPVEEKPAEETPVEEAPVEEKPVEEAPVEETPAEEAPRKEKARKNKSR